MSSSTGLDVKVLRELSLDPETGSWPSSQELDQRLELEPGVARAALARLESSGLAEHDHGRARRWGRTPKGVAALSTEAER